MAKKHQKLQSFRYMSEEERERVRTAHKSGVSIPDLCTCFGVSRSTIYRILSFKSQARKPCGGRKPSTSKRDDDYIRIQLKKGCKDSVSQIVRRDLPEFSYALVRKRMASFELQLRSADVKPPLNAKQRRDRIDFATEFKSRRVSFWRSVYFCDECLVFSEPRTRQRKVICGPDFPKKSISPLTRSKFPSRLMIWVGIKYGAPCRWSPIRGTLNSAKFVALMNGIFADHHSRNTLGRVVIFQDNAPCHISRETVSGLSSSKMDFVQLPPNSPDLNVIENFFSVIKREMDELPQEWPLEAKVRHCLEETDRSDLITKLVDSMPKRLSQVLKNKGGHTDY